MEKIDICGTRFGVPSDKYILETSYCNVTTHDTGQNQKQPDSLANPSMGSVSGEIYCQSCFKPKKYCYGHSGHLNLNTALCNTMFMPEIINFLKRVCYKCSYHLDWNTSSPSNIKKGKFTCARCGEPQPAILENVGGFSGTIVQRFYEFNKETKKESIKSEHTLMPNEIEVIFNKIHNDSLEKIGIANPGLHPKNFVNRYFYIPPNSIRPNAVKTTSSKVPKNDINAHLNNIIKENAKLGDMNNVKDEKYYATGINKLSNLNSVYKRTQKVADNKNKNLPIMLTGKNGYIRGNVLGSRTFCVIRNFITGNPIVKLDEVYVPIERAKNVSKKEIVTRYNKHILQGYLNNYYVDPNAYPRINNIYKKKKKSNYLTTIDRNIVLEEGDIIHRDLIDGDIMAFCRQPTLMISNICSMKIMVRDCRTLQFNPNIVVYFGADFDGDAMNLFGSTDPETDFEMFKNAGSHELMISNGYGTPIVGQTQDGTLGLAMITRAHTRLSHKNACRMFNETGLFPQLNAKIYTGHDILTVLFQHLQIYINFSRKSKYCNESFKKYRNYVESEERVVIKNGVFMSGIIDKECVGDRIYGGLNHVIYQKYGARVTMEIVWYMQRIAINYLNLVGYTIGIRDFLIDEREMEKIRMLDRAKMAKSELLTQNLHNGKVYAPSGKTVEEFYETEQLTILTGTETYNEFVHTGMDYEDNKLYFSIYSGTKGTGTNLTGSCVSYGQQTINGNRLDKKLSGRSTFFYHRDSPDPCSRGYIHNSLARGLNLSDMVCASFAERKGIIDKALGTARSGAKYRESISSLDSVILNNFRQVVKGKQLRQLLYCGDGMDPRATYRDVCELIYMKSDDIPATGAEKETLLRDRDFMREILLNQSLRTDEKVGAMAHVPVNLKMIIEDVFNVDAHDLKNFNSSAEQIEKFIADIPKLYFNSHYTGPIPEYIYDHCKWFQCYLRYALRSEVLKKLSQKQVQAVIKIIKKSFINNLENPGTCVGIRACQAISEPNTQQLLKSVHGVVGNLLATFENIMSATTPENDHNIGMSIYLHEDVDIKKFAKNIEMVKFKEFVANYKIFFEYFGNITHPQYLHENKKIQEKLKFLNTPPTDLLAWCIRFEFQIDVIINKNISVEDIALELEKSFPYLYVVPETINAGNWMRVYIRNIATNAHDLSNSLFVQEFTEMLLEHIVRGVDGINSAHVCTKSSPQIENDEIVYNQIEYIRTSGSNLGVILLMPGVDTTRTRSSNVIEMQKYFGITTTKTIVIDDLRNSVPNAYYGHYTIYAEEMCSIGYVTALNRIGSAKRGTSRTQLIADSAPIKWCKDACAKGIMDNVIGPNSALIQGTNAKVGTNYNQVVLNTGFYEHLMQQQTSELQDL